MKNLKQCLIAPLIVVGFVAAAFLINTFGYNGDCTEFLKDGGPNDIATYFFYGVLLVSLIVFRKDFANKKAKRLHALFCFFTVAAVLREAGIQHWLASRDTTAMKLRFFTNPDNPIGEKILSGLIILSFAAVFVYTLWTTLPGVFRGFFKMNPLYWSIMTFLADGFVSKVVDRVPGNLRKWGVLLDLEWYTACKVVEETMETCLPVLAIYALWQYHTLKSAERAADASAA